MAEKSKKRELESEQFEKFTNKEDDSEQGSQLQSNSLEESMGNEKDLEDDLN